MDLQRRPMDPQELPTCPGAHRDLEPQDLVPSTAIKANRADNSPCPQGAIELANQVLNCSIYSIEDRPDPKPDPEDRVYEILGASSTPRACRMSGAQQLKEMPMKPQHLHHSPGAPEDQELATWGHSPPHLDHLQMLTGLTTHPVPKGALSWPTRC